MREVIDEIETLISSSAIRVAQGKLPTGAGWTGTPGASTFNMYTVIYMLPGSLDGPQNEIDRDLDARIQLTCVGPTFQSVLSYADGVLAVIRGARITAGGLTTREPIFVERYGPVDPEDTDKNVRIFTVKHILGVNVTPTS